MMYSNHHHLMSTTTTTTNSTENDSKYTVADILSSMASGQEPQVNPAYTVNAYHNGVTTVTNAYRNGVTTETTPTLTPTTLSNIEQTFIELQNVPGPENPANRQFQSGFVPPLIEPASVASSTKSDDPDWSPVGGKKLKTNSRTAVLSEADIYTPGYLSTSRKPPQRKRDDKMPPEECERRRVRRERNKVAAAKCRQRRVDHTNVLVEETDVLDDERHSLENEIHTLQQQKEHLEFLLQAHRPLCKMHNSNNCASVSVSSIEHDIKVKAEPRDLDDSTLPYSVQNYKSRPNHLSIKGGISSTTTDGLGVPITTPSSGIFTFGLDSMVDGHTGLTPITGMNSCSSQHQKNNHSDSSSPDSMNSPTLISL